MTDHHHTRLFLGSGRCYHTMDWFRATQELSNDSPPTFVTDLVEGEGFPRLLRETDLVHHLVVIDRLLPDTQSRLGNIWRNVVKLLFMPVQIVRFRRILRAKPNAVVYAHSTYYAALARFASSRYVATPQGSEVLVRPQRSVAYRIFARFALEGAEAITVDSPAMAEGVLQLCGRTPAVIQNGIDLVAIEARGATDVGREKVLSVRGLAPNYQIERLLDTRNKSVPELALLFAYPFAQTEYRATLSPKFRPQDRDLGSLARAELYRLLRTARLVISIPISDSSPRTVYEAIFCGSFVAATRASWLDPLPECMRARIIVVDLKSPTWLTDALDYVAAHEHDRYVPSAQAVEMFDQRRSAARVLALTD